jgi:hypothetical protein
MNETNIMVAEQPEIDAVAIIMVTPTTMTRSDIENLIARTEAEHRSKLADEYHVAP